VEKEEEEEEGEEEEEEKEEEEEETAALIWACVRHPSYIDDASSCVVASLQYSRKSSAVTIKTFSLLTMASILFEPAPKQKFITHATVV
jgi:hypothetical protein